MGLHAVNTNFLFGIFAITWLQKQQPCKHQLKPKYAHIPNITPFQTQIFVHISKHRNIPIERNIHMRSVHAPLDDRK